MKLFSKRNKKEDIRLPLSASLSAAREKDHPFLREVRLNQLIKTQARVRLVSLIKFLTASDLFLEKYILIDDKKSKIHYFNKKLLDDFSESELGYNFSSTFTYSSFTFSPKNFPENEKEYKIYDDYILFDLLETTILFSKEEKRAEVINRIANILKEENTGFFIKENLITRDEGEDLRSISSQLKDSFLTNKIKSYYTFFSQNDFVSASKVSADLVNIITSDDKISKKSVMASTWQDLSESLVLNLKEKDARRKEFIEIMEGVAKVCQKLNNEISDVRHSEKDRIQISNEYFYKLICSYNISLVEVVLTSLKDRYISTENWEEIKNKYLENYRINKDTIYYIPDDKETLDIDFSNTINPEDIPF